MARAKEESLHSSPAFNVRVGTKAVRGGGGNPVPSRLAGEMRGFRPIVLKQSSAKMDKHESKDSKALSCAVYRRSPTACEGATGRAKHG
jgi:hypothetical protein